MIAALYLKPLDDAIDKTGLFYAGFMDDWVVQAPTRWKLRKAINFIGLSPKFTYGKVNYYQRRSGVEMDFVLPEKNLALEVKRKGNLRDYHKLSNLAASLGITEYYVVSQSFSPENGIIPVTEL